jgi:hypothetical protein
MPGVNKPTMFPDHPPWTSYDFIMNVNAWGKFQRDARGVQSR